MRPAPILFATLLALAATAVQATPVTTDSGLVYEAITEGQGDMPKASDIVKVHYKGMFADGKVFDSSYQRGEPTEFPLGRVIPCWTEGLQKMKVGGKAKLICPPQIAYGARGAAASSRPMPR